jgi:hypothetical protein
MSLREGINDTSDAHDLMATPARPIPLPPAALLKAARRVLRPLVRLMMHSGVTFPLVADALRRLFVEVAVNDILTDPKARTDSRISILTGVHRKEIKRLRETALDSEDPPDVVTLASQIVGRWVGSAPFCDDAGRPRALARVGAGVTGEVALTFDALVESITSDIRPRAVLDDLLSHGVVVMDGEDRVQLNADAFIPRPGGEEQLFYFARNLHDHVSAAAANIIASHGAPFLDRSVHYDRLTAGQAKALQEFGRSVAVRALLEVNRRAVELTSGDPKAPPSEPRRFNFGVYVFEDEDEDEDKPSAGG